MAQKTDARIFRQNINNKNWQIKHNEKNNEESSFYLYKTLEIQKYVNRFFGLYKMKIHNCKIFYSSNSLRLFVSFYISNERVPSKRKKKKRWPSLKYKVKNKYRIETIKGIKIKKRLLKPIICFKRIQKKVFKLIQTNYIINFEEILLNSLAMYTNNKVDIYVTLQRVSNNKQLSHVKTKYYKYLKVVFKQLKSFAKNDSFKKTFKKTINILFIVISTRKSAKLLADFLAEQFRLNQFKSDQVAITRKDNYFLGFLKQILLLLIKYNKSCLTGVKIVIKGRFNKAPRAKSIGMYFGKFPLQSFDSKIDYHQSTAYTKNGTFGIKIWLAENLYFTNYVVTTQKN